MKRILLIPNEDKDPGVHHTSMFVEVLKKYNCEYRVITEHSVPRSEHLDKYDLYVVLGGDGTIMRISHIASKYSIPILGINLGRVGYMAELEINEFELISRYFNGDYRIEERMMLDARIGNESFLALNDVVLSGAAVSKMISFDLYNNGDHVRKYNADGVIIATPTGSTAYSLSAGGPIIDPRLDCILSTPVCPHSLTAKPMIFSAGDCLEIKNSTERDIPVYVTVDGANRRELMSGESIKVFKSRISTKFIRIKKEGFYRTLANKME